MSWKMVQTMKKNEFTTLYWLSGAIVALMFLVSVWGWVQVPAEAQIPVHWGIDGTPDRYGGKFEGLMLMPLVALAVSVLLAAVPQIDPRKLNIAQSAKAYRVTWGGMLIFFFVLHLVLVAAAVGYDVSVGTIVPVGIGILFIVMGNYMGKIRSNYMFGIRTPWTLASDLAWNKTHRLGGKLFMGLGLVMLTALWWPAFAFSMMMVWIVVMLVVLFIYSYYVWKSDPQARPSGSK